MTKLLEILSNKTGISISRCTAICELLDTGATIPFIARYRKEMTGNADDDQLRKFQEIRDYSIKLFERKEEIIRLIKERSTLTDKVKNQIDKAQKLSILEDIFRPFKEKKNTRAQKAIQMGLEPLANVLEQARLSTDDFMNYTNVFLKKQRIKDLTCQEAIQGAMNIIAEKFSDDPEERSRIRYTASEYGTIEVKKSKSFDDKGPYANYSTHSERAKQIPGHRFLAIMRGVKEKQLSLKIDYDTDRIFENIKRYRLPKRGASSVELVFTACKEGFKRLVKPSIEREVLSAIKERADISAIKVFEKNLAQLLMTPGIKDKNILGVDPGFKSGCKLAVMDKNGRYLANSVIYPNEPQKDFARAEKIVINLVKKYDITTAAIGNGTASRETREFFESLNKKYKDQDFYLEHTVVSEAGASVYSASKTAQKEFPKLDVTVRGAISISRRLLDPMAELVKIDPKSLGIGQYQHDLNQKLLEKKLADTTEKIVNKVGVNLNTASAHLLAFVAGLGTSTAQKIIDHRDKNGSFTSRKQLLKVSGIGTKAYEQCAGFLRIKNSKNPLDNTGVHPDNYDQAKILQRKYDVNSIEEEAILKIAEELKIGPLTLKDIIHELQKPGFDPRDKLKKVVFSSIRTIENLKIGVLVSGVVRNLVDFGAFVDIGLKNDALIHISQISNKRVSHPMDVLSINQFLPEIKVISVDLESKRVGLSLKEISR